MRLILLTIATLYVLSVLIVHLRGRARLRFGRQLLDHSGFFAPYNVFMYAFSAVPAKPYLDRGAFGHLDPLREQWQAIREEALHLFDEGYIRAAEKHNDASFASFFKEGWKRFYLTWYGEPLASAHTLCPNTVALLETIPEVKAAMFALLPPGAKLNPHRDPFAGSMRYHLGLATPNDDRCFIEVDGQRYSWRDGQGVIFDETYIHWAENASDSDRLILFCDVERPMRFRWMQAVNRWLGRTMMTAAASPNETGDQTGLVSKLFRISYVMGQYRRRYKAWNKTAYKATKVALIVGVAALIYYI